MAFLEQNTINNVVCVVARLFSTSDGPSDVQLMIALSVANLPDYSETDPKS